MRLWLIPVRALLPCLTIVTFAGVLLWGPWVGLVLAVTIHIVMGMK